MKLLNNDIKNIAILGASFDTGNLGVSALASSTISLIKRNWPKAHVYILGGRDYKTDQIEIDGQPISIETYPVRYCSNLFIKNHIWKLLVSVILDRITPSHFQKTKNQNEAINHKSYVNYKKTTLNAILNADMICDITGGDSFSDIYGMSRFVKGYLLKWTGLLTRTPFIMLPQTYGPFKSPLTRWLATKFLKKSHMVYSRDKEGLKIIEVLIGKSEKVKLCPDVAFILAPKTPRSSGQLTIANKQGRELKNYQLSTENQLLIGLNVSGLLYSGGYSGKNEFGLKVNYRALLKEIIDYFITQDNTNILLVPHVVPEDWEIENDLLACRKLRDSLHEKIKHRIIIAEPNQGQPFFDQCEIKYLIGQCAFFLGSRMHATIAAISQCIPTIGLAYSKKFTGVYETVGVADCVADLRSLTNEEVMVIIKNTFCNRMLVNKRLEKMIPEVKRLVYSIFNEV
jgi:polysaccharide pyruvyl transferase WcaK-like protein